MAKKKLNVETKRIKPVQIVQNEGQLKGLPKNPRFIRTKAFEDLKKSITDCPEMTEVREVVLFPFNENYIVIAGNQRFRAMEELGFKDIACKILPKSTPMKTVREIAIKDNVHSGKDDWEIIGAEWDKDEIEEWNKETPFEEKESKTEKTTIRVTIIEVNEDEREKIKKVLEDQGYTVK